MWSIRGDGNFLKARQEAKKGELDEQLKEYINEWRKQRSKEEEELKRLKEKQAKRKEIRAEQGLVWHTTKSLMFLKLYFYFFESFPRNGKFWKLLRKLPLYQDFVGYPEQEKKLAQQKKEEEERLRKEEAEKKAKEAEEKRKRLEASQQHFFALIVVLLYFTFHFAIDFLNYRFPT